MVHWQHTPYNSIYIVAVLISVGVLVFAWRQRYQRGGRVFTAAMAIIVVWAGFDALQLMAVDQSAKLMWRTLGYAAHNLGPITLLVFALIYTGREAWVTPFNIGLLAIEPVIVGFVVAPTTTMHGLVWRGIHVSTTPGYAILEMGFGPWYWINTAYNYVLVLAAIILFLDMAWGSGATHRNQGIALVAGIIPPFVGNISWVAGLTIIDVTALGFALTGAVWGIALYRYRLLDLIPVGRHAVLEDIPDGYLVLDDEDRIVDQNAAAGSMLGEVVGMPARRVLPDAGEILDRPMDEEGEAEMTFTIDGRQRHYRAQISPLGSDEVIGRLVLLRDVTEQRAVKNRYQALIENSSDLIAVLDDEGTMRYMSPSSKRILGYDASTLENTSAFERIHPDDVERTIDEFRKGVEDPDYEPHLEYRYRHGDGSWIWLESRGRNLLGQDPVDGFVVNSRDVTARRQREEELRRQKDRLDEFASVVSHDLRNPLNVIAGRLELAQEFDEPHHLEVAAEATDHMNQLVDELLSLARQGRSVGETEPVRLEDVSSDGWSMAETEVGSLCIENPDVTLEADPSRLSELLSNLFHNAIVHGTGDVTVRVGANEDGFYVEDDGPGIPEDERDTVFDRGFSTGDDGTGLGLAIVKEIVDAHGWTVAVSEGTDGGARFEITGVTTLTPGVPADDD